MDWFDFDVSSDGPVPIVGRLRVRAPFSNEMWKRIREEPVDAVTWIIQIDDVGKFVRALPDDMKPPTQRNPEGGLPKNVWAGGKIEDVWPAILDVRARVRFLIVDDTTPLYLIEAALGAWRCSNCGRRGRAPRPQNCPHAANLCGDAQLLPEIHWVVDVGANAAGDPCIHEIAETWGAEYWPEEFPHV